MTDARTDSIVSQRLELIEQLCKTYRLVQCHQTDMMAWPSMDDPVDYKQIAPNVVPLYALQVFGDEGDLEDAHTYGNHLEFVVLDRIKDVVEGLPRGNAKYTFTASMHSSVVDCSFLRGEITHDAEFGAWLMWTDDDTAFELTAERA